MAKSPDGEPVSRHEAETNTQQPPAAAETAPVSDVKPGDQLLNPVSPLIPTVIEPPAEAAKFMADPAGQPSGYPKRLYHPVHGEIELKDPGEESRLQARRDWFDTPEQADMARTASEAWIAQHHNMRRKLQAHDDAGQAIVRNSNQSDQSLRSGQPEPL
jgi:hypothetical protein